MQTAKWAILYAFGKHPVALGKEEGIHGYLRIVLVCRAAALRPQRCKLMLVVREARRGSHRRAEHEFHQSRRIRYTSGISTLQQNNAHPHGLGAMILPLV